MAGVSDYYGETELQNYLDTYGMSESTINSRVSKLLTTSTNGIEALPYQFMGTVDRRIANNVPVGRKYAEKIFSRLPLLFLTPCEPLFMDDFSKKNRTAALSAIISGRGSDLSQILSSSSKAGRYYSVDFNYAEYYRYLNVMLAAVSAYLGIYETRVPIAGYNGSVRLGTVDWRNELNADFKTFFSSAENIVFYLDGMESVSESFTNSTQESSIASTINGYSDMAKEIRYLFGPAGEQAAQLISSGAELSSNIVEGLTNSLLKGGAGIVNSLTGAGVNAILNGGKIIFPKMWGDSDYSRSYSIDIKLRSPDHDSLSIFLSIIKPYCKLLALTMPRQGNLANGEMDPNSYWSPFLVRAYSKGLFNIDMGIITSMNVTKGAQCCWNDDGLPTQIDIQLEIEDLYSHMAMSYGGNSVDMIKNVINNTTYMDFLANMAGLNIAQMDMGRRITLAYYLTQTTAATLPSNLKSQLDQSITRLIGSMYNTL